MANDRKKAKKPAEMVNLREEFMRLSNNEQLGVTSFFDMHNTAHWIYYNLSADAQKYISYCIRMNANANDREANPDKYGGIEEKTK